MVKHLCSKCGKVLTTYPYVKVQIIMPPDPPNFPVKEYDLCYNCEHNYTIDELKEATPLAVTVRQFCDGCGVEMQTEPNRLVLTYPNPVDGPSYNKELCLVCIKTKVIANV
jgi:hypothetical protein